MMLHRANTANALPVSSRSNTVRTTSPRMVKPDFRSGSILDERDKSGRVLARYRVGALLGRGGFAKCYEVTDLDRNEVLACKVIDRASLAKSKTLQKLHSEIAIHRRMKHRNVVNFLKTFQDDWFVYLLLEKCSNQTLMEVAKTRRRFSTGETQFIMAQSIAAIQYMHEHNVIHRDLKLGNMMMDKDMNVKIGDFGLAAELSYDGERKRTICGTPNYIAPEILEGSRQGHSFEVDVWSLGVILYTLLVGEPPFQTNDVKVTYNRIKQCRYTFPSGVDISESGKQLVHRILQSKPDRRPTLMDIRSDPFFRDGVVPTTAPLTLFPEAQRRRREMDAITANAAAADVAPTTGREALRSLWGNGGAPTATATGAQRSPRDAVQQQPVSSARGSRPTEAGYGTRRTSSASGRNPTAAPTVGGWCAGPVGSSRPVSPRNAPAAQAPPAAPRNRVEDEDDRKALGAVHDKLHQTFNGELQEDAESARLAPPPCWVTDYADFSSKYGLTYKLSTGHTGVHYNDSTKMVWEPTTNRVEYYARVKETVNGVVHAQDQRSSFHMEAFPENLNKKVTLIKYFKSYLARDRSRRQRDGVDVVTCSPYNGSAGAQLTDRNMVREMVYVKRWLMHDDAMIFRLSNKSIQVCFHDKAEVILSSESKVVTYTDKDGNRKTITLVAAAKQNDEMASRLKYTKEILSRLINNREL